MEGYHLLTRRLVARLVSMIGPKGCPPHHPDLSSTQVVSAISVGLAGIQVHLPAIWAVLSTLRLHQGVEAGDGMATSTGV